MKAYAYAYLFVELTRIAHSDRSGRVAPSFEIIRDSENLREEAEALSHAEHGEAIELAKGAIQGNTNCCIGLWMAEQFAN